MNPFSGFGEAMNSLRELAERLDVTERSQLIAGMRELHMRFSSAAPSGTGIEVQPPSVIAAQVSTPLELVLWLQGLSRMYSKKEVLAFFRFEWRLPAHRPRPRGLRVAGSGRRPTIR